MASAIDPAHPQADLLADLTRERFKPIQSPTPKPAHRQQDVEDACALRRSILLQGMAETADPNRDADVIQLPVKRAS